MEDSYTAVSTAPAPSAAPERPVQDLREWLARTDQIGELVRVTQPVDPDEEMSAITYLVGKQEGGPALLFEKITGYPRGMRALWNPFGSSRRRIAVALDEDPELPMMDLIRATMKKLNRAIPPREVAAESAPVNENVLTGEDVERAVDLAVDDDQLGLLHFGDERLALRLAAKLFAGEITIAVKP